MPKVDERWKDIPNYENRYEISNYGVVRNKRNGYIRKLNKSKIGYFVINLWNKETQKRDLLSIHHLVATLFVKGQGECVNHIDGNKENNYYKNLEWCSLAYNTQHAYKHKLINNHKSIRIVENGLEFRTITNCAKWLKDNGYPNASTGNICSTLKGNRHNAYGYTYEYINKII